MIHACPTFPCPTFPRDLRVPCAGSPAGARGLAHRSGRGLRAITRSTTGLVPGSAPHASRST